MPYNGSDGTFTLSDTIAPSTLADATELQAILTDIQDALTAAVAKSGESSMTGPLKASNGSQSLPSFTFGADPDTGIYRIAANQIGVSAGDKTILAITSADVLSTVPISAPAINVTGTVSAAVGIFPAARVTALDVTATLSVGGISLLTGALNVTATVSAASSIIGALLAGGLVATQAQQETGTVVNTAVSPGRQQFHASAAKAWVRCGTTGNNLLSYNTSSITDSGVGAQSPVWTVNFSSANCCMSATAQLDHGGDGTTNLNAQVHVTGFAASGAAVITARTSDGAKTDPSATFALAFGDQ